MEGGLIEIFNANEELGPIGAYPRDPSPDEDPATLNDTYRVASDPDVATLNELQDSQIKGAMWLLNRPINIGFRAVCKDCPGYENSYGFSPPFTLEGWLGHVFFLDVDKNWMGRRDVVNMIRFWFTNRGLEEPWIHGKYS